MWVNGKNWIFFSVSGCSRVTPDADLIQYRETERGAATPGFAMSTTTRAETARIFSSMGLTTNFLFEDGMADALESVQLALRLTESGVSVALPAAPHGSVRHGTPTHTTSTGGGCLTAPA